MSKIKMSFIIEVDGEVILEHSAEQDNCNHLDKEREFALEVINRLNCFYSEKRLYQKKWVDLIKIEEEDQRMRNRFKST